MPYDKVPYINRAFSGFSAGVSLRRGNLLHMYSGEEWCSNALALTLALQHATKSSPICPAVKALMPTKVSSLVKGSIIIIKYVKYMVSNSSTCNPDFPPGLRTGLSDWNDKGIGRVEDVVQDDLILTFQQVNDKLWATKMWISLVFAGSELSD